MSNVKTLVGGKVCSLTTLRLVYMTYGTVLRGRTISTREYSTVLFVLGELDTQIKDSFVD